MSVPTRAAVLLAGTSTLTPRISSHTRLLTCVALAQLVCEITGVFGAYDGKQLTYLALTTAVRSFQRVDALFKKVQMHEY